MSVEVVKEFHELFDHPVLDTPQIPEKSRADLRVSLIQEELDELKKAISEGNLVEAADALCDLQYVLSGAVLEFGMADKFKEMFEAVHSSNMSKACKTVKETIDTQEYYSVERGVGSYFKRKEIDGQTMFLVFRQGDNKALKSVNYTPVDLKPFLNEKAS